MPLLPYQRAALENPARLTWNCWSRQTGKSFTFALRRLLRGMRRNRNQILLSAGQRQSRELMAKVHMHLKAIQRRVDCTIGAVQESQFEGTTLAQLETRVAAADGSFDFRVIALPANPETARGYTGDVFLDEFAMHRDSREIYGALYPILTRGRGEMDICSTPVGRKNQFYKLRSNPEYSCQTVTIEDAVRDGLDVNIAELQAGLDDELLWQQEFLCQFLDEATAFLTMEMIAGCEDLALDGKWTDDKREATAGEDLYVGMDIGRRRDLTVIWVWGRPQSTNLLLTRAVIEMPKARFGDQREQLFAILAQPNTRGCCIDASGLGMNLAEDAVEAFGARAEAVDFTQANKASMAGDLRIKVEDRLVRIPAEPAIRNDWHSIERIVMPGGAIKYASDRHSGGVEGHADRFWAAALGVRAANAGGQVPLEIHFGKPLVGASCPWFPGRGGRSQW